MASLWKIAVALLLAYVLSVVFARLSSLAKGATTKAYHNVAGRNMSDPELVCEIDTTNGRQDLGLRILVGRTAECTLSSGEVRGQAETMFESADKLASRITEMQAADVPLRVLTFEYPTERSMTTRGVYLDKARRVWASTEDGTNFSQNGYATVTKYDREGRWCIQYLVPKDHTKKDR